MGDEASIADSEIVTELELRILGGREWLARARAGKFKRPPETIDLAARRLATLEAGLKRFKELAGK